MNLLDHIEDRIDVLRSESERWFVEQQDLGASQESARDREDLLLATG